MKVAVWLMMAAPVLAFAANMDESFFKNAAEGGMAEVNAGQLAQTKGASQSVKDFGAMMVKDHTAANQKLTIQTWVIYDDQKTQRELPVYRTVINVHVPGFWECLKRIIQGDPDYWLKYGLPGGAGFLFVSGALAGLWKWIARKKKGAAPEPATP